MRKLFLLFNAFLLMMTSTLAQVGINNDNSVPNPSAMLDVKSTSMGFLPPRMTTVQRDAVQSPATGLTIFNTELNCLEFYAGSANGWHCPCLSFGTISCTNPVVMGTYMAGIPLTASNTVSLTVNNTTTGGYNISTNTGNGIRFSKMGTFTTIGSQIIALNGSGTPAASGTTILTVTYGTSGCSFTVTVSNQIGLPCPGTPTVVYEGQTYNTVQIGTQCWLKKNLNIGTKIPGAQEQANNGIIEKYCYNNDDANCSMYGGLYQWNEMMQYVTTQGVKGICPTGWHIPTDGEWTTLSTFLGGTSVAGGKMKSTGTIEAGTGLWYSPNTGATNESGFTAVPAGSREYDDTFYYIGFYGIWWSSSEDLASLAWYRDLGYYYSYVYRDSYLESNGFSVRCLRDL